jgi:hypothetical protein
MIAPTMVIVTMVLASVVVGSLVLTVPFLLVLTIACPEVNA